MQVRYLDSESSSEEERYAFAYTITISNRGAVPSQLLNRRWIITDGRGEVQEVAGPGVVGQQPRLRINRHTYPLHILGWAGGRKTKKKANILSTTPSPAGTPDDSQRAG